MNLAHPYGYPVATALFAFAAFYLAGTWQRIDEIRETRRNRRLDRAASADIRQRLAQEAERQ